MYNLKNDKKRIVNGTQFILAKEIGLGTIQLVDDKKLIENHLEAFFNTEMLNSTSNVKRSDIIYQYKDLKNFFYAFLIIISGIILS